MTIDIHPHVISTDTARYPNDPVGGKKSDWSHDKPVSVEQMLVAMDQAGIAKSVLVQASTCYGHDNSYLADSVAAYPDRFTGVFSVDVLAPDAPETIRYWVGRKLTGMRHCGKHDAQSSRLGGRSALVPRVGVRKRT
jgi:L-fuconolactonase